MIRLRIAALLALASLLSLLSLSSRAAADPWSTWPDPGRATRAALFAKTFKHHFTLGQDAPIEWLDETFTTNGAKWDAKVGYLSGGAARPDVSPPVDAPFWIKYSDFPTNTIKDCKAAKNPCVTWFTFYALAQSYPGNYGDGSAPAHVTGGPAKSTPYNAKLAPTMRAYFELFKYLMQKAAAQAPYPVVVHVEPDEWGHLLLSGTYTYPNLDPNTVDVKVGSTGMPELAGFPDDMHGFASAFKKLRDTYAPDNVMLITNPSGWDGDDGHTMSGANFGKIMKDLCGEWEGAVFETGDRDQGMSDPTRKPPYVDATGVPTVSIRGNFDKHVQWINDFHAASGLPVFVWQAAAGNTYFDSCSNTPGHYMDDLAQTLLENYPTNDMIARYAKAGCIGWMFNAGQGDSTHVYDAKKDGITNPTPAAGNLGNKATYADDDGGYMRLRGAAYYAKPYLFDGTDAGPPGDSGTADAAGPDATTTRPDGDVDAAAPTDGATDAPAASDSSGCGCTVAGSDAADGRKVGLLAMMAIVGLVAVRRGRRR